jgi:hypothetical protein
MYSFSNLQVLDEPEYPLGRWYVVLPSCLQRRFKINRGVGLSKNWNPDWLAFNHFVDDGDSETLDFPAVVGDEWFCMSGRMKRILESFSPGACEFLPIILVDETADNRIDDHFIVNFLNYEHAVDKKRSELMTGETRFVLHGGDSYYLDHIVLQQSKLVGAIGRVVGCWNIIYCRDDLRDALVKAGITGIQFKPLELS